MPIVADRVAPLRIGVKRAAPGSQVLSDFEVKAAFERQPLRIRAAFWGLFSGQLFGPHV